MKYDTILERKADHAAFLSLRNALRLHIDSVSLYKLRSYPSAPALSILSMEEIAKAHLLEDIVFNSQVNEMDSSRAWEWLHSAFFSHRWKHTLFAARVSPPDLWPRRTGEINASRFFKAADTGRLEALKRTALYVDFRKIKRKSFRTWPVQDPLRVSNSKPRYLITLVNDYIIDLAVGHMIGIYAIDSSEIESMLNPKLVRKLTACWRLRGRSGKEALRRFRTLAAG